MPYTIDWKSRSIYRKYMGRVTGQEFLNAIQQMNADPNFETYRFAINDFTGCTEFTLSARCIEDVVAAAIGARVCNPNFVAAFVSNDEPILLTLMSLAEMANNYLRVAVFRNVEEALLWTAAAEQAER